MTPQPQTEFDVFLSYSSDDEHRVVAVETALEGLGLRVWRDRRQIPAGESFIRMIEAGLRRSRCVVLFNSQKALASAWVQREWNVALTVNMRIIPVRLDESEMPLMLRPEEFIDLRDPNSLDGAVRQIAEGIRGLASPAPDVFQASSNPSVLGKDVAVIERMIASGRDAARRLVVARWAAAVVGVAIAAGAIVLGSGSGTLASWIPVAVAGPLLATGAIVWVITAQLGFSRSEVKRLISLKDGIELYCPNQAACEGFRIRLETILKKSAGIGEAA